MCVGGVTIRASVTYFEETGNFSFVSIVQWCFDRRREWWAYYCYSCCPTNVVFLERIQWQSESNGRGLGFCFMPATQVNLMVIRRRLRNIQLAMEPSSHKLRTSRILWSSIGSAFICQCGVKWDQLPGHHSSIPVGMHSGRLLGGWKWTGGVEGVEWSGAGIGVQELFSI